MNYVINMYAALRVLCPLRSPPSSRGVAGTCYPLGAARRPADLALSLVLEEKEELLELPSLDSSSDVIPRDLPCNLGAEPFKSSNEMFAFSIISRNSSFVVAVYLRDFEAPEAADITLTSSS